MSKDDEKVLVVPADVIFKGGRWQGLQRQNMDAYLDLIHRNYQFKRRGDVETDPSWQQIIPYIVFSCGPKFFVYKYLENAGEARLHNTYQLGVAGHINLIDHENGNVLESGMMREWEEEVDYKGNLLEKSLVGILNDDSRPVESVHLGLVYHFVGDSPDIAVKEKEKMEGHMADLQTIGEYVKNTEGIWIKVVYNEYLLKL